MEYCVITDIKNGVGNIIFEILVGLHFSKQLTITTGHDYEYYGYITPRCMYGHLIIYNKEHQDYGLPHPLYLPEVFPDIRFVIKLPEDTHNHHLLRYFDVENFRDSKRVYIVVDSVAQMLDQLNTNLDILEKIKFNPIIYDYTEAKYKPSQRSIGVHIRVPQVGDYMNLQYPNKDWYVKAMKFLVEKHGLPDKIFLVTGISTAQSNGLHVIKEMSEMLHSDYGECEIVMVESEPYYVDMAILSLCGGNVLTASSFSTGAALSKYNDKKTVVYPDLLVKQLMVDEIKLDGFYKV